jgi:hypothetical protein
MEVLYSDRGSNFISAPMMEVYNVLGISKQHTVAYNPQGNGVVERLNKTLVDSLSHLVSDTQTNWCEQVPLALLAFRTAFHRSIQETPSFLVYGRDLMLPYDLIFSSKFRSYSDTRSFAQNLTINLQSTFERVAQSLHKASLENVSSTPHTFTKQIKEGDVVYLHVPAHKPNLSKKLCKFNKGPYRVIKQIAPVLFKITHIANIKDSQTVHLNRLIKVKERQLFPSPQSSSQDETSVAPENPTTPPTLDNDKNQTNVDDIHDNPPSIPAFDLGWFYSLEEASLLPIPCASSPPMDFEPNFFDNLSPASFISNSPSPSPIALSTPTRSYIPRLQSSHSTYNLRPRSKDGFVINNKC